MRARWGMAWVAVFLLLLSLLGAPLQGMAADAAWSAGPPPWNPSLSRVGGQSSLEAQLLGERPFQSNPSPYQLLSTPTPGLSLDRKGGATVKLLPKLEMNISVLYNREPKTSLEPKGSSDSPLFLKYSMDYRLLPNLQVGLNGYLFHPYADDSFLFRRSLGNTVLGMGPGLKYDLGRWSFVLKSQLETGNRDRGDGLQNWFRVWYAF